MPEPHPASASRIGKSAFHSKSPIANYKFFCSPTLMELRKDPITRSWVITGDDVIEPTPRSQACRFCGPTAESAQVIATLPGLDGSAWSARSIVHPHALYHIEGEASRRGDGLYDRMGSVGAHEVLLENPRHDGHLWNASDAEVEQFLRLAALRIQDLKRDARFKYISIFKNHGAGAGQEFEHPLRSSPQPPLCRVASSTNSAPARVFRKQGALRLLRHSGAGGAPEPAHGRNSRRLRRLLSLRTARPLRDLDHTRSHEASFERTGASRVGSVTDLAALLRRTLQRIRTVTEGFHLVLHTSPNSQHPSATLDIGRRWMTITTGISRFCPCSRPRQSPTRLKRFIIRQLRRKQR